MRKPSECASPGRKIRSKGKGRGLGIGRGKGPVGRMAMVADESMSATLSSLEEGGGVFATKRTIMDMQTALRNMGAYIDEVGDSKEMEAMVYQFATLLNWVNGIVLGQRKPNAGLLVSARKIMDDCVAKLRSVR